MGELKKTSGSVKSFYGKPNRCECGLTASVAFGLRVNVAKAIGVAVRMGTLADSILSARSTWWCVRGPLRLITGT